MSDTFEPRIVGFFCKWCTYAGADLAGTSRLQYPPNVLPIRVMCSSRVDPVFLITAYLRGADAVLIGGCHPGDCHYIEGNYYTRRRMAMMKTIFESLGLEPERLRLSWISASEGPRFASVITEYTENTRKKGPNPVKSKVFI
ncbi:hydrogenase iron-sulfur subunit [bacterium]|nr:hydrogenase iron-sulfur subunit [bacterium]